MSLSVPTAPNPEALAATDDRNISTSYPFRRYLLVLLGLPVLLCFTDIAFRFLPVHWLHVLPEHEATRRPPAHATFIPNLHIHYDPWVGETATTANQKPTETRPAIEFSTDDVGFRLTPGVSVHDKVAAVFANGASFSYGGGLSDDETFPAVFSKKTGLAMYNGGRFFWDGVTLEETDWLLDHLGNPHAAVVLLYWEDQDLAPYQLDGPVSQMDKFGPKILGPQRYSAFKHEYKGAFRQEQAFWFLSPMEICSTRALKFLSNDVILPNAYKDAALKMQLPDGKSILMLKEEVNRVINQPDDAMVERNVAYFVHFQQHLAEHGNAMYVMVMPNKYTLYGPLLHAPGAAVALPYVDRVEASMNAKGIKTLNVLHLLQPYVEADVTKDQMSYYREDHHWTPLGVRRIVDAFAAKFGSEIGNRAR